MAASLSPPPARRAQKKPPRLALRSPGFDDDGGAQDAAPAGSGWSPIAAVRAPHERFALKKRGRVESAHLDGEAVPGGRLAKLVGAVGGRSGGAMGTRSRRGLPRSQSAPSLLCQPDDAAIANIFPDINPRSLRIAEVRSWYCAWMDRAPDTDAGVVVGASLPPPIRENRRALAVAVAASADGARSGAFTPPPLVSPTHHAGVGASSGDSPPSGGGDGDDLDAAIHQLASEFALEDKRPAAGGSELPATPSLSSVPSSKRPQLRLKLEGMPTSQQAEDRAQRAANRLIAKREAIEQAMEASAAASAAAGAGAPKPSGGVSATQSALLRLNFKSYSSGEDSDLQSPSDAGRHSAGSAYSPNHGMFTTKTVAVSEAGISSPDSTCLHLQDNLAKVREVGRGASGIVYKAIHIPTLKVVAIKDVPVYGRGQRRQMVRELHALYANLVPISETSSDIWSFGLALISVALGNADCRDVRCGVVKVANEQFLSLPADRFSPECRSFVQECVRIDPDERPSAQELLSHPFVTKYSPEETLADWTAFIEERTLCEERVAEVDALAEAVYRHIYERCVKFSFQPQSDYGVSFLSQATPTFSRRHITIDPKRSFYSDKLLEDYCYSPQSWTASPGDARRQQLFGSDSESPGRATERHKGSFWRKLQRGMSKLGSRRKRSKDSGGS
ncbi:hypothetical protein PybrP1_005819 [[Pythium] brassicae (nom. inval.)]|nr:hypothetical protein PybrP1_005819 [[Pythium] brassicae (nom. inval.)]